MLKNLKQESLNLVKKAEDLSVKARSGRALISYASPGRTNLNCARSLGFQVNGFRSRVEGLGFGVSGLGFKL